MPVAARALGGLREYGLAFSLFLTTSLLGIVVAGEASDRRGPAEPMLAGLTLFGAGLLLSGTASSFLPFLVGRAVSGLGAGVQMVATYVLVAAAYPVGVQPRVFGLISAGWVLPSLLGPPIAGVLATEISWRAPFLAVLPLLPAPFWVLWARLRRLRPEAQVGEGEARDAGEGVGVGGSAPAAGSVRRRVFDGLLLATGAGVVQWGLQVLSREGQEPVWPLAGVVLGAAAIAVALHRLWPAGVVRVRRGLPALVAYRTTITAAFFGAEAFVPLMLVEHRAVSPALAGLALTFGALGWFAGSWSQGRWGDRLDRFRLVVVGAALIGVGVLATSSVVGPGVPWLVAGPTWAVAGFGMGWGMSCSSVLLLRLSAAGEQGRNASAMQIGDSLGSTLGIGGAGALFAARYQGAADGATFAVIWVALGVLGVVAAVVATRIRPAVSA